MRSGPALNLGAVELPSETPNATASASRTMAAAGRPVFAERSKSARCKPQRSTVRSSLRAGDDKAETFIAKLVLQRRHRAYPALTYVFNIVDKPQDSLTSFRLEMVIRVARLAAKHHPKPG
jgi:hypothetical protein